MQKTLIVIGAVVLLVGIAWPWLHMLRLGRLPGDIVFKGESFTFYLPITTMILISLLLSLIFWLLR